MAEYYPLISRAVAGLRGGAPAARQAIYGRARSALIGQLRGMQPPVPEEAIDKEIAALDDAVARIEAELAAATPPPSATPVTTPEPPPPVAPPSVDAAPPLTPPARMAPPVQPVALSVPAPVIPTAPVVASAPPAGASAPPAGSSAPSLSASDPASGENPRLSALPNPPRPSAVRPPAPPAKVAAGAPARADRAVFERRATLPTARPITPRPPAQAPADAQPDVGPEAMSGSSTTNTPDMAGAASRGPEAAPQDVPRDAPSPIDPAKKEDAGVAPVLVVPTLKPSDLGSLPEALVAAAPLLRARSDDADDVAKAAPPVPDLLAGDIRPREEGVRPAIPRQTVRPPRDLRVWIVAVAALAAVVAIALTAWKLRDNPEELARAPSPAKQEPTPGKIVERADGAADDADAETAASTSAPTQAVPQTPAPASAAAVPTPSGTQQPVGEQGIAVAYKAAVVVAAPDMPDKVKAYVGTVVWRTESVTQGPEQPLGMEVRADIDVPEAKFQAVMELRRNTEAQFPASHTIDVKFTVGAGSPIGNVKQIDVPRMRSEDAPSDAPLVGVPVTITANYFLVGLTRGPAEQHNLDAIRSRGWFDIPMVLENGTPAKITFEKGTSGDRIIADALATWSRS